MGSRLRTVIHGHLEKELFRLVCLQLYRTY